ncbi:MAG: hypothetical protein ACRCZE_01300 [Candidatus Altimarinota bacterium]
MQNENLTPNGGGNMPDNRPVVPNNSTPEQKPLKPWMIGLGALGVVVVVGLAVTLSQGDLFKGQLALRDSAIKLTTNNDYSAEVKTKGLDFTEKLWEVKLGEKSFTVSADKRMVDSVQMKANGLEVDNSAYAKTGLGEDLYLKLTPVRDATASRDTNSETTLGDNPIINTDNTRTQAEAYTPNTDVNASATAVQNQEYEAADTAGASVQYNEAETLDVKDNASATYEVDSKNEITAVDGVSANMNTGDSNGIITTQINDERDVSSVEQQKDLEVTTSTRDTSMVNLPVTTSSTSIDEGKDGIGTTDNTMEVQKAEDTDKTKLESSLFNVAHAAISKEMACQIDKNFIVKCTDVAGYPNNLYTVNVNNAPEANFSFPMRIVNSSCKDFDGLRFDPAEFTFNDKDTVYTTKMYAYLGSDEFAMQDVCRASWKDVGAQNGTVALKISEAANSANYAEQNMQAADMSKEQALLGGFVTATEGGALKIDLAKAAVGGSVGTLKANAEYNLQVAALMKTLSPVLKIKSLGVVPEQTMTPVLIPEKVDNTMTPVIVTTDKVDNTMTPVIVTGTRDRNCSNLDRLAFTPNALTYTEGEANAVLSSTLSGYEGGKEIGIPFDQSICGEAINNLQLEGSGFYIDVVNTANKTTVTQLLDMSDDTLDAMGQKAILEGFNLFDGILNVKLTQNEDKQIKLVFNNDLTKRSVGKELSLVSGQLYQVNLRGVLLKDSKAGQVASNFTPGDKVLASYTLRINERPVTVTQPTQTTTTTTSTTTTTTTTTPEKPVKRTERSTEPCVVGGKNYYFAEGPDSSYCRDLQGLETVLKTDQAPETPQVRYTTALAVQRIINEIIAEKDLDARFRVRNITSTWYSALVDGGQIASVSTQEMADFKNVYATGILKGRINPQDRSEITLAPLDQVTYAELLSILRQAVASVLGVNPTIKDNNLPTFLLNEYRQNPDLKWVAEAVSFGVEYNIIEKDEFNRDSLFSVANREDMASYLTKFRAAIDVNSSLLSR